MAAGSSARERSVGSLVEIAAILAFVSLAFILLLLQGRSATEVLKEQIALERAERRELMDRLQSILVPHSFAQIAQARQDPIQGAKEEIVSQIEQLYDGSM